MDVSVQAKFKFIIFKAYIFCKGFQVKGGKPKEITVGVTVVSLRIYPDNTETYTKILKAKSTRPKQS